MVFEASIVWSQLSTSHVLWSWFAEKKVKNPILDIRIFNRSSVLHPPFVLGTAQTAIPEM